MTQVGVELNEKIDKWCENRSGWLNDRVKGCISQRINANKDYRRMRKICGVDDERTKRVKDLYWRKKQARKLVGVFMYIMKWW